MFLNFIPLDSYELFPIYKEKAFLLEKLLEFNEFEEKLFLFESEKGESCQECLCPKIWSKSKDGHWSLDPSISRKIQRVAENFLNCFSDIVGDREVKDIQITGDLSNYLDGKSPDLDVHVLVNFDGLMEEHKEDLIPSLNKRKFEWETQNPTKLRGYNVDFYLHNVAEPHTGSGLYSVMKKQWLSNPSTQSVLDKRDAERKASYLGYAIESLGDKLQLNNLSEERKTQLVKGARDLKRRIQKMRASSNPKVESVSSLSFKKLRNEGYIHKLVRSLSLTD